MILLRIIITKYSKNVKSSENSAYQHCLKEGGKVVSKVFCFNINQKKMHWYWKLSNGGKELIIIIAILSLSLTFCSKGVLSATLLQEGCHTANRFHLQSSLNWENMCFQDLNPTHLMLCLSAKDLSDNWFTLEHSDNQNYICSNWLASIFLSPLFQFN